MAITFINSTSAAFATAASTASQAVMSSRLGGAALVLAVGVASSAVTVSTVTDNAGNTWLRAVQCPTPKPAAGVELWYALNCSSASTRVSVTLSGASSGALGLAQFDGVSTANALLETGSSAIAAASSGIHSASQITPSQNNALVVVAIRTAASLQQAPLNWLDGFTQVVSTRRTMMAWQIQTTASTTTGSFTNSSAVAHAAVIAAFSDTFATGPVVPFYGAPTRMAWGYGV